MSGTAPLPSIDDELRELTQLAGLDLKPEVLESLVELTRLDVVPTAISQVLKSLCSKARAAEAAGSVPGSRR